MFVYYVNLSITDLQSKYTSFVLFGVSQATRAIYKTINFLHGREYIIQQIDGK